MAEQEFYYKRWFKNVKIHKCLPPNKLVKDSTNISESLSYSLYVNQVSNIQNSLNEQQQIRILFNLYNTEDQAFFGRTYESQYIDIENKQDDEQGLIYQHKPIIAYFHLKHNIDPPVEVVIEVILYRKENNIVQSRQMLGWCTIPLKSSQGQKLTLKQGSCRYLLNQNIKCDTTVYTINLDIDEFKELDSIKHLIPEGCICGFEDEILGVQDLSLRSMKPIPDQLAYVSQVKLLEQHQKAEGDTIQRRFKVQKCIDQLCSVDLQIVMRRLMVGFHNGWTFTNSRGLNNFITLEEGKTIQIDTEYEKVDHRQLVFKGALDVSNVYREPPLGVFVVQLEYDLEFMVINRGKERLTQIIGWAPIIPEESFEEDLIVGPGNNINHKYLVDLSEVSCPITVSGKISYGSIDVGQLSGEQQAKSLVNIPAQKQEEKKQKMETMDDKTKIKVLEQTIRQFQQEKQMSSNQIATDFENKLKLDKQREAEYMKVVDQLKKQHEDEITQITIQYEELKRLMSDINHQQQQYLVKSQQTPSLALMQVLICFFYFFKESVLYEQMELEKWKIVESMAKVPRKQIPKNQQQLLVDAQYGNRNLTRADIAFLSQNGIRQLFNSSLKVIDNDDLSDRVLSAELNDKRQGSNFYIQLLCFSPRITCTSENLEPTLNYYSEEGHIPKRVEVIVNFYDFPLYKSETLIFQNAPDQLSFQLCLQQRIPLIFMREHMASNGQSRKEPIIKFEVPHQLFQYQGFHKIYCQYLYNKSMTIELWDADSKMMYGTFKLPMRALMRQGKETAFIMKKVDILGADFKKLKGDLQLLVRNDGKQLDVVQTVDQYNQSKTKVVSNKSVTLKQFVDLNDRQQQAQDPDDRIKERIKRFKVVTESSKTGTSLHQINKYKDIKKNAFVRSVLQDYLNDEKTIYPLYGKLEIVCVEFTNPSKIGQNFVISLDDQEHQCTGLVEAQIVSSATEWKYLVESQNLTKPSDYNLIQCSNDKQYIFLNGQETITLLVKYITFRHPDPSINEIQNIEELLLDRGKTYLQTHSYPKQIGLFITTNEGQRVGGMRIRIFPKPNSVDHVYRFHERDNRQVQIIFPAMYGYNAPTQEQRPKLYVTNKQIMAEWANDFEIRLTLRMGEVNKTIDFNILAYGDIYFNENLANWKILIQSLAGLGLEVPLGQVQLNKLTINVDITRQVRFYSSHPLNIWFPKPFDNVVDLNSGRINIVNFSTRIFTEQVYRVLINCVDINSKDLIKSWIIVIAPAIPPISQLYDVTCPKDREKSFIIPYVNKLNQDMWLVFVSSNPQILEVIDSRVRFKGGETNEVRLRIHRIGEMDSSEAKIFVGNEDRTKDTYDCLLLRIKYI